MKILVSGLLNTETSVPVRGFPVPYYPIDYPSFGVTTAVSGVAFNIAKALRTLGEEVRLLSMVGRDMAAEWVAAELRNAEIDAAHVLPALEHTPSSVVLFAPDGARQIYCDLKDIQETAYPFDASLLTDVGFVAACNINFNRPLLHLAQQAGVPIATDVHVLTDPCDAYNREFMECAELLFLSDEGIGADYVPFLHELAARYPCRVVVLGRGAHGAAMYLRDTDEIIEMPVVNVGKPLNTVGAGDALFSAFLQAYAHGCPPRNALHRAQVFAAHKITANGASNGFLTAAELEAVL